MNQCRQPYSHLLIEHCQCQCERIKCPVPVPSLHLVCLARTAHMVKSTFQCLTVNNDPYTLKVLNNTDVKYVSKYGLTSTETIRLIRDRD